MATEYYYNNGNKKIGVGKKSVFTKKKKSNQTSNSVRFKKLTKIDRFIKK